MEPWPIQCQVLPLRRRDLPHGDRGGGLGGILGGVVWNVWSILINVALLRKKYEAAQAAGLMLKEARYPFFIGSYIMDTTRLQSFLGADYEKVMQYTVEKALADNDRARWPQRWMASSRRRSLRAAASRRGRSPGR